MEKSILLVDDDSIFNFINTQLLNNIGFTENIHAASNGKEALDLINSCLSGTEPLPDIIFLDLIMPIVDGFAFIEAFKS